MIYVNVEGVKSEGRGVAGGNSWHDTDDVIQAISEALAKFHRVYDALGHGAVVTYRIDVGTEASPRRTTTRKPLAIPRTQAQGDDRDG